MGDGLVMEQLHYPDEIKAIGEVPLGEAEPREGELELAVQLIQQASSETFDPTKYHDDVRDRMLELIQKKIDGEDITQIEADEPKTQIIDLMEALKASLAKASDGKGGRKPAKSIAGKAKKAKARKVSGDTG